MTKIQPIHSIFCFATQQKENLKIKHTLKHPQLKREQSSDSKFASR